MKNEKNIKRYTAKSLQAMRVQGKDQTDWNKVDQMTERKLEALIAEESDEQWDWTQAELINPGRKTAVHLRVDADVLRFFKQQGKGYQTRINAVLRTWMLSRQHENTGNRK
jgi:uncharacterized protein (DUF4415 family)